MDADMGGVRIDEGGIVQLRTYMTLASLMVGAGALSACGSSASHSANSSGSQSTLAATGTFQSASADLSRYLAPPQKLYQTPLSGRPAAGKKVIFINCSVPICLTIATGVQAASSALGWSYTSLPVNASDPSTVGSTFLRAVSLKPDFIVTAGLPHQEWAQGLAAAQGAHIPVLDSADALPPMQARNDVYATTSLPDVLDSLRGRLIADWIVGQSQGKAHVAWVDPAEFEATNGAFRSAMAAVFATDCPATCSVESVPLTISDFFAGKSNSVVVSYLQSHPSIGYLAYSTGDLADGAAAALASAGLHVKITGQAPGKADLAGLVDGSEAAWAASPTAGEGWALIDAAARVAVGDDPSIDSTHALPTSVVTHQNVGHATGTYEYPLNYVAQYKALWHVQ